MLRKLFCIAVFTILGAGLAGCNKQVAGEASCDFVQNGDLQRVSWGASTPLTLYIDNNFPTSYYDSIHNAANVWNKSIGREVIKIGGVINTNGIPKQDGSNVIYYLPSWEPDRTYEQARTTVYWSSNRIFEADVRVNGKDFSYTGGSTPAPGKVDMESLLVHEFGHVLGLVHTTESASVMVKSLPSNTLRRALSTADNTDVKCEY